ncbi:MAG: response regulator [Alphaproteobacteria bacterium]|nr:response regulator [Alphaproteobacteria bacterium]
MKSDLCDLRVLLVEDQPDSRALIRNMLIELGITQVFESSDGKQALQFMDTAFDFIDIVICDWNMPGMTGVELLRQLRSADPSFPFLMVTGRADRGSVMEARSSGVTGYIAKPFSPTQLEAKLRVIFAKMPGR